MFVTRFYPQRLIFEVQKEVQMESLSLGIDWSRRLTVPRLRIESNSMGGVRALQEA